MSASPLKADIARLTSRSPLCANSDRMHCSKNCSLFDHLVGEREQRRRNVDAERLRRLQVDDEVEFARLHDRQFRRLFALEDTASIGADFAKVLEAPSVTHHPACVGKVAKGKNRRERVARRERQELATAAEEKRVGPNYERIGPLLHNARKGHVDLVTGAGGKNVDLPPDG